MAEDSSSGGGAGEYSASNKQEVANQFGDVTFGAGPQISYGYTGPMPVQQKQDLTLIYILISLAGVAALFAIFKD